ncbi:hypothetical protein AWC38_SpisGene6382 [Stylophora pistillata]|uniref:Uncharacterized protein n=1 Tax=Stylophora pistillata TaxID=50429 RepID=A0A2B4SIH0_STYPI|nr:hypothetical protein AWC38_SpisGene6382 [Stylophora pistillata]
MIDVPSPTDDSTPVAHESAAVPETHDSIAVADCDEECEYTSDASDDRFTSCIPADQVSATDNDGPWSTVSRKRSAPPTPPVSKGSAKKAQHSSQDAVPALKETSKQLSSMAIISTKSRSEVLEILSQPAGFKAEEASMSASLSWNVGRGKSLNEKQMKTEDYPEFFSAMDKATVVFATLAFIKMEKQGLADKMRRNFLAKLQDLTMRYYQHEYHKTEKGSSPSSCEIGPTLLITAES